MIKRNHALTMFCVLFCGYLCSVILGIATRQFAGEHSPLSIILTFLPTQAVLFGVSLQAWWLGKSQFLGRLFVAILIWFPGPIAVAMWLFGTAIGCDEGMINIKNYNQPIFLISIVSQFAVAIALTVVCLSRVDLDLPDWQKSIRPYVFRSWTLQLVLAASSIATFYAVNW